MCSLPGCSGVSTVYHQGPPNTGTTQQGAAQPGTELAEVVREREDDPGHGMQGEVKTLFHSLSGNRFCKPVSQPVKSHVWLLK